MIPSLVERSQLKVDSSNTCIRPQVELAQPKVKPVNQHLSQAKSQKNIESAKGLTNLLLHSFLPCLPFGPINIFPKKSSHAQTISFPITCHVMDTECIYIMGTY